MTKSKKMLATIIVLVIMFVSVTGALVAVLVANTQSAKSNVHVKYTSTDVNVRVEAKYYVGTTGTDLMNGTSTYIDLSPTSETGLLNQVAKEVLLDKNNDKIIYEYKFTNLSDKIPAIIRQTVNADNTLMIPTDTYNNVGLTYTSSSTSLGSGATSDKTTLNAQGLPINTTRYVYVIVSITDLLKNVAFNGDFGWTLEKGEAITTNASSGSQSIVVDTTDEKLYNKSAMENLQLVVGVENTEPEYPMIEEKHFSGWYSDSGYNNLVEFPMIPTASTKLYPKTENATTTGVSYTYNSTTKTYGVSGCSASSDVALPDVYDDATNGVHPVTSINSGAFEYASLGNLKLCNNISTINSYTFVYCSMGKITIPRSVIKIEQGAFKSCSATVEVDAKNEIYTMDNNNLIEKPTSTLIRNWGDNTCVIPSYIKVIGEESFTFNSYSTIVIPEGVEEIKSYAFSYSTSITSITIPSSIKKLERYVFDNCDNLTSVKFANPTGWTVTTSSTATTGDAVTISATDFAANATLLKTTHVSKYWNRA